MPKMWQVPVRVLRTAYSMPELRKESLCLQDGEKWYALLLHTSRDQVFKVFPAIANLADKFDWGQVSIVVEGSDKDGYDPNWLSNAVEEPLDEDNIEGLKIE